MQAERLQEAELPADVRKETQLVAHNAGLNFEPLPAMTPHAKPKAAGFQAAHAEVEGGA